MRKHREVVAREQPWLARVITPHGVTGNWHIAKGVETLDDTRCGHFQAMRTAFGVDVRRTAHRDKFCGRCLASFMKERGLVGTTNTPEPAAPSA